MESSNALRFDSSGYWICPESTIAEAVIVCPGVCIGLPSSPNDGGPMVDLPPTQIGPNCYIGPHSIVYRGATLEDHVVVDPFCRIGARTHIGSHTRVLYGARIHNNVRIGTHCIVGGNCSNGVILGDHVTHMGRIAHKYNNPKVTWTETDEPSAVINDHVVIGANALIIGPVTVGRNSYVAAGEVVRSSVPDSCIVYKGRVYHGAEWQGELAKNAYFEP